MEFTRKKQRGWDGKTRRQWLSACGNYRITWVAEVDGVRITPHCFALVRCYTDPYGSDQWWTFAGRRGPYGKFKNAVEACEKHEKLWLHAIQVAEGGRKGRNDRLRAIDARARIGKGPTLNRVMMSLPVWVRPKANSILMSLFFPRPGSIVEEDGTCEPESSTPDPNDPTDLSLTSESDSSGHTPEQKSSSKRIRRSGPASDAKPAEPSTTRKTRRTASKGTKADAESPALPVKAPAAGRKRSSREPTAKPSKTTSKSGGRGKGGKRSSAAPTAN